MARLNETAGAQAVSGHPYFASSMTQPATTVGTMDNGMMRSGSLIPNHAGDVT